MNDPPRRRWFTYSLRTFFVLLTVFGVWLGVQVKWIRDRQAARAWIRNQNISWYAPSLRGARVEAAAPWSLRLLNESGMVAIGIAEDRSSKPYSVEKLRELFPEARVGYTGPQGRLLDSRTESH